MAERKAILSNRLYVPRDQILPHHFREFTYDLYDSYNKQEFRVETFQLYPDHYGFCRGDIGKLQRVFTGFDFDDRRSIAPFPYKLKLTKELRPNQAETLRDWIASGYGMLVAPARWGKCVTADSLVTTAAGTVPISLLAPLEPGESTEIRLPVASIGTSIQEASWLHHKGNARTIKIKTSYGYRVEGTEEHPVLTLDRSLNIAWTPLKDVRPGHHFVAVSRGADLFPSHTVPLQFTPLGLNVRAKLYPLPSTMTQDLSRLLGYLVSEGTVGRDYFRFFNKEKALLDDYEACFLACFGVMPSRTRDPRTGVYCCAKTSVLIADFLSFLGLRPGPSRTKEIPLAILVSSKITVAGFLRALFDGDGWVERDKVKFTTASEKLAHQVHVLLANFGVTASCKRIHRNAPSGKGHWYWQISIFGKNIDRFHDQIGFGLKRKNKWVGRRRKADWTEKIPGLSEALLSFVRGPKSLGYGWYDDVNGKKVQLSVGPVADTTRGGRGYDRVGVDYFERHPHVLGDVGSVDPDLAGRIGSVLAVGPVFWDEVSYKRRSKTEKDVYDLTVPGAHSFVANSIVVHNTVWMTALVKKLKQRALMLAHVEELCHQLEETFREFTNVNELEQQHGVRLCGVLNEWDDFFPILTLSTYQCFEASAVGRKILSDKRDFFGLVMVDECHRAATEVYTKVVGKLDAMYRVGVTATPTRKDHMHCIASDMLGPVRVVGVGEQLHVDYEWVYTNTEVREFASWGTMWGRLCKAKRRNTLIAKRIVADVRNGRFVLCTTERLAHIDAIRDAIVKIDPDISIAEISGRIKGRDALRKAIKRGEYQVTIAMSKIIELGYNIPRWSTIHATLPMTNKENWYQRISRIRTPMEPAFEGDTYEKPTPLARIYIDTGHKAIWAYKSIVKKVNDKFKFTCLNPDKPREKKAQPRPKKGFAGMKRPGED